MKIECLVLVWQSDFLRDDNLFRVFESLTFCLCHVLSNETMNSKNGITASLRLPQLNFE